MKICILTLYAIIHSHSLKSGAGEQKARNSSMEKNTRSGVAAGKLLGRQDMVNKKM